MRLDFELKESINRAKEAAGRLPEDERRRLLQAVAEEHGLTVDGTTIHLPDIQVEYENRDGEVERQNLELLSRNYREARHSGQGRGRFQDLCAEAVTQAACVARCTTQAWFERFCRYDDDGIPARRASSSRLHEARE